MDLSLVHPSKTGMAGTKGSNDLGGKAESLTIQQSVAHRVQSRAKRAVNFVRCLRKAVQQSTGDQTGSPLFRLPLELREEIWAYALAPGDDAKSAHLHVYDKVYDCCTYDLTAKHEREKRERPKQMSLLMTCRAIYEEALHFLYDTSDFTVVLCAGLARPRTDLKKKNCMGKMEDCRELFLRMRRLTIVVQPGSRQPDAPKYAARISSFLGLIDFGKKLRYLCLQFNFHHYMGGFFERRDTIRKAFKPLCESLLPTCQAGKLKYVVKVRDRRRNANVADVVRQECHEQLGPCEVVTWLQRPREHEWASPCLARGTYGQDFCETEQGLRLKLSVRQEKVVLGVAGALYFLTLPVSLPVSSIEYVKRKRYKGEW